MPEFKKIALLTDGIFPYVIGGMQKHSYYLARFFAQSGIAVDLYHFSQSKEPDIHQLECFTKEEKKHIRSFVLDFPKQGWLPGHYLRASYRYSELIFEEFRKNMDVDFIYAKGFAGWKLLEEKRNGLKCAPVGVKFHGMNMYDKPFSLRSRLEQRMLRPAAQFNMDQADVVFSYGGKVTDLIHTEAKIPLRKIIEIPTGIERSWISTTKPVAHTPRRFLYIGRYERLKGIQELMRVIKKMLPSFHFEFHFVGPIPESLRMISPNIIYHGSISGEKKIREIMAGCDVLVCPSYSEGMPNVILEAMSRGLAVISSDVGAVRIMVSGETGWLIRPGNEEDIEQKMTQVIRMPDTELLNKQSNAIENVSEHFLWEEVIKQTISKIGEAISRKTKQ